MRIASSFRPLIVAPLFAAAVLVGCASAGYHYSQLDGHRYYKAPIDTHAVQIVRVDGKDTVFSPVEVDPGLRQVTVQGPPTSTSRYGEQRTIDLNVAPCTRYYLVAVKDNRLLNDFTVKVDYQEPIGGCTPPVVASK
ncbi:MAG TPA: hypothetical protein VJO99_08855 [Burkholderiaceae bacterium]|nr:hypothetical protein [Burkholderiaceae bacterium]